MRAAESLCERLWKELQQKGSRVTANHEEINVLLNEIESLQADQKQAQRTQHRLCCLLCVWANYGDHGDALSLKDQTIGALADLGYPLEAEAKT